MTRPTSIPLTDDTTSADFGHIREWVFDLDNTLYPRRSDLFSQIDRRMTEFVAAFLQLPRAEARVIQKDFYRRYGTTLRGLMQEHEVDPDAFLRFVHDIDYSWLQPDPRLGAAIAALPGRKFIFTNGDRPHAERAARQLGILDEFDAIFDLVAAGLVPKPASATYDAFFARHGVRAGEAAMFEDLARNLTIPKTLGMRTVLVVPPSLEESVGEAWEHEGREGEAIDFVTDDLGGFLETIRPYTP